MNGYIVSDADAWVYRLFGYPVCAPQDIRRALADNPPGETLTVEVNNYGGSLFAGFEIYSILRGASCPTLAEVQSLSASSSSIAMLGCGRVTAAPVAQIMIHNPVLQSDGDQNAHRETANALEGFTQSMLNAYELKCRGRRSREELAAMLNAETWLTVQQAVDAGLVDEVLGGVEALPEQVVNAVGGGLRALSGTGGLPSAAELRARAEAQGLHPPGGQEPSGGERERVGASLALKRFY